MAARCALSTLARWSRDCTTMSAFNLFDGANVCVAFTTRSPITGPYIYRPYDTLWANTFGVGNKTASLCAQRCAQYFPGHRIDRIIYVLYCTKPSRRCAVYCNRISVCVCVHTLRSISYMRPVAPELNAYDMNACWCVICECVYRCDRFVESCHLHMVMLEIAIY